MPGIRFAAALCLLPLVTGGGCYPRNASAPRETPPRPVYVIQLREDAAIENVTLIGVTEPWQTVTLYFEVPGVVAKVFVEDGDSVEEGQSVALLVRDDFELGVAQAEAEVQASDARLKLLQAGTRKEDLEAAAAEYARTQTLAVYWKGEWARAQNLARDVLTESERDRIRHEYEMAIQAERASKSTWEKAVAGPRPQEIDEAQAAFHSMQQAQALAQRQLDKATLRAPVRGYVEQRFLDPGAYVNVFPTGGVPVVQIVNLEHVDAVIDVPEALLSHCVQGATLRITSAVQSDVHADATILSLGKVADLASGTYRLRARFANPERRFRGGMVITGDISKPSSRRAIYVPLTAVGQAYGQPPYVLLVDPRTSCAVVRQVVLGPVCRDRVEIAAGLDSGELLIVRGQDRVIDGDPVQYERASPVSALSDTLAPSERLLP